MITLTDILIFVLCIVAIVHVVFNIYTTIKSRYENESLLNLQQIFNATQKEFFRQKNELLDTIKGRDEYIKVLSERNRELEFELTELKKEAL